MAGRYDYLFPEDSAIPDSGVQAEISQGGRYDHLFDGLDSIVPPVVPKEVAEQLPETSPLYSKPSAPVQSIIPTNMESARSWTTPKPAVPDSPRLFEENIPTFQDQVPESVASGARVEQPEIVPDQPEQKVFEASIDDLVDSLKSGSYGLAGRMLNLWADKEKAYRENPDLYLQKIAGLSPYAGLGAMFGGEPGYTDAQKKVSKEQEIELLEEAEKLLKKSSDLGRPLSWKETEIGTNFWDYMTGLAGSTGPSMAAGMVTMGLASPLLMEAEVNQEIRSIPGLDSKTQLQLAETGGLIAGALEVVGLGIVARGIPKTALAKIGIPSLTKYIEKHISKDAAKKFTAITLQESFVGKTAVGRFAAEVVKKPVARVATGSLGEAGTEAGQEKTIMETAKIAHEAAGQKGDLYTPEEESERLEESFIGGGLVGGPIRGGVGAVSDARSVLERRKEEYLGDQLSDVAALQEASRVTRPTQDYVYQQPRSTLPTFDDKGNLIKVGRGRDKTKDTQLPLTSSTLTDQRPEEEVAPDSLAPFVSTPQTGDVSPTEGQEPSAEKDAEKDKRYAWDEPLEPPTEKLFAFERWLGKREPEDRSKGNKVGMDNLEEYLEGGGTFEGWLKEKAKNGSEEIKRFADSFTPEVLDELEKESSDPTEWITRQSYAFRNPPEKYVEVDLKAVPRKVRNTLEKLLPRDNEDITSDFFHLSPKEKEQTLLIEQGLIDHRNQLTRKGRGLAQQIVGIEPETTGPVFDENGRSYVGETDEDGQPHGQGVLSYDPESGMGNTVDPENLRVRYEGEFKHGIFYNIKAYNAEGKHTGTWKNGDIVPVKGRKKAVEKEVKVEEKVEEEQPVEQVVEEPVEQEELVGDEQKVEEEPQKIQVFNQDKIKKGEPGFRRKAIQGTNATVVTPDGSMEVGRNLVILDLSEVVFARARLQGRDRGRQQSADLARNRAVNFDPAQVVEASRTSDSGPPLVTPSGVILSGNGRTLTITELYENPDLSEQKEKYLAELEKLAGKGLLKGIKRPILVQRLKTDEWGAGVGRSKDVWEPLQYEQAVKFADASNISKVDTMSTFERAKSDGKVLKTIAHLMKSPEVNTATNSEFIQQFAAKAVSDTESGDFFQANGRDISVAGIRRIEDALLTAAYGENETILAALEDPDNKIKSLKAAMLKAAPRFSEVANKIDKGDIPADMDITPYIIDAVEKIKSFKETRTTLADDKKQDSLFEQEETELSDSLIEAFYNDDGDRTRSKEFITKILTRTVDKFLAQDYSAGIPGLEEFSQTTSAGDILAESIKETKAEQEIKDAKAKKKKKQGELDIDESDSATVTEGSAGGGATVQGRATPKGDTKGILTKTQEISSSVREQIYVDMAMQDEEMSPNLGLEARIGILKNLEPKVLAKRMQKMVEKKFRFKFVDDKAAKFPGLKEPAPPTVEITINNMMNLYQNGEGMAAALGIPLQFLGLDGTLGLTGREAGGRGKYPAWYTSHPLMDLPEGHPVFPFITITGRHEAFAHEWGHALDYHILTKLGEGWHKGAMSGRLRGKEAGDAWLSDTPAPERFKYAFADLLNALFYEHGADAAAIMDLQQKLTKATSQKVIDKYNRQIQELKDGMSKKHLDKSKFKLGAEYIGDMQGENPEYWNEPTELFARAFETYVAHIVTQQAHTHKDTFNGNKIHLGEAINPNMPGTEYLGKPNSGYIMSEKDVGGMGMISKMYPQESDRLNIYSKFDALFDAMVEVFNKDEEAASAKEGLVLDYPTLYLPEDQGPLTTTTGWQEGTAVTKRKAERWKKRQDRLAKRKLKYKEVGKLRNAYYKMRDLVWSTYIGSKQGNFESYQKRYPHIKEIGEIMSLVMPDPGGERFTSNTWNDAVPRELRRRAFIFKNLSNKWKAEKFTEEDLKTLRLLATSDPVTLAKSKRGEIDANIMGYAGAMRTMLNSLWDYANNNGVEMNFLDKNAYLPRMLDLSLVNGNEQGFLNQAKKLYKNVIWKNDHGALDITSSDQLVSIGAIAGEKRFRDIGDETIDKLARLSKRVSRLKDEITELEDSKEFNEKKDEQIGELQEKIDAIMEHEDTAQIITEGYEAISNEWAELGSSDWLTRLRVKSGEDPSKSSPIGGQFTKSRKLPKEADTLMVDYYLSPVDAIQSYITSLVRKTEYERLFSRDKIPTGEKRKPGSMQLRDYKEYLFDQMAKKGVHENDVKMMRYDLDGILGNTAPVDDGTMKTLNTFHSFALMALLPRAVATSLPEPFVAGIKMRSTMKGLKTFVHTLDELLGKVNKDAAQRTQLKKQIGAILGVFDDPDVGEMMAERMGGHLADDPRNQERMNTFFVRTALQGVTNAQRRATMLVSFQYLRELGDQYNNPVGMSEEAIAKNKKAAELELMDLGIPKNKLREFSEYMTNVYKNNVSPDSLMLSDGTLTEMAQLLSISTLRITDRSIQNPMISSRPRYAETVIGRLVYSIQSFNYSFTRNVLVAEFKRYQKEKKHLGSISANANAAKLMGPIFQLYIGHVMVSAMRMFLLDREKWDEKMKEGNYTLEKYLAEISFNRSGALGFIEPWYQSYRAVRYQRDLATSIVGATPGYYLQPANAILKYYQDETNSPNTTSAEKKALEAFYTLVITPTIVAAVSNPTFLANLGPLGSLMAGLMAMVGTSKTAKTTFSKAIVE